MRICDHNGCDKKHDSHGFCTHHARQFRKYGHILTKEEKFLNQSVAATKRLKKFYAENPNRPRRKISLEKRAAMKGVRKNTGRTHFQKGITPWNKGTKGLMGAWNKGIKRTPEQIEHLRQINIGRRPWNKIGDGVTPQNKLEREKFRKQLQMLIFQRDDFTCQICEVRGGNLQVDHIKRWAEYPELRFEKDNCRTVCMACHYYITFKRNLPEGVVWGHNLNRRITS